MRMSERILDHLICLYISKHVIQTNERYDGQTANFSNVQMRMIQLTVNQMYFERLSRLDEKTLHWN